jgi:hypothetical protein
MTKEIEINGHKRIADAIDATPEENYTKFDNDILRSPEYSAVEVKLLGIFCSNKEGWVSWMSKVQTMMQEGEKSIKKAMKELEFKGHVRRYRYKSNETGKYVGSFLSYSMHKGQHNNKNLEKTINMLMDAGYTVTDKFGTKITDVHEYPQPGGGEGQGGQPPGGEGGIKNTNSKKTNLKKTNEEYGTDEKTVTDEQQAEPVKENGKGGEDGNPVLYLDTQKEEEESGKGKEAIGIGKRCRTLENGILPEDGNQEYGTEEQENGTGSKEEFLARIKKGFGENSAEYELANILFYQDAQKLAKKYCAEYRFPIGDAEKFNSYKARIGRKPSSKKYYVAATNLYEMMPQSGKDKIDAYVNYELEMWDTSKTDDIESLRRKIMYEYFSLEPCFLHYYAMNEKQREYYKNRKPKKKKEKKLDKELDRIYKDCGLDRNKDCDPGLDYDYEAGNLTEDELKAKLLAEVAA